ncbi:MAG: ABC transporter ATP-binding protein [Planctomycetota bacterium]
MSSSPTRTYGDAALYRRLLVDARPYWGGVALLVVVSLLAAPLALLFPVPVKIVVDHVLGDRPLPDVLARVIPDTLQRDADSLLVVAVGAVLLIALLMQLQQLGAWLLRTQVGQRLVLAFRARLFDHLQRLSLGYHHRAGAADSLYRLQFDAGSIQSVAVEGVIPFATALVKVVVLLVAVGRLDATLAWIAIAGGPALFVLTELFRGRLRRRWAEVRERESDALGVVSETLGALRVVKAFGQEARESARYRDRGERHVQSAMRAVWVHGVFDILVGVITGVGAAALLWVGARHVQGGQLTLGELLMVFTYLSQLFEPLREVGTRLAALQGALASAERVYRVLDEAPEAPEKADALPLTRARGEIRFDHVTFGYDPARPVLVDVDITIPAGSRVGIAGPTGSGKSTLLGLLPRFHEAQQGRVLLDGTDIRDFRLKDLRAQMSMVLQDSILFRASVAENIAYGRPGASRREIEEAARQAAALRFIQALPQGLDTQLGEGGGGLSGGERQRLSLARAFLRDAPILILDEPTSALDSGTEAEVLEALERLMVGRTTLMIAHRLSTLEACDLRLEVADARVRVRRGDVSDVPLA